MQVLDVTANIKERDWLKTANGFAVGEKMTFLRAKKDIQCKDEIGS
jgi:hypothetical protein